MPPAAEGNPPASGQRSSHTKVIDDYLQLHAGLYNPTGTLSEKLAGIYGHYQAAEQRLREKDAEVRRLGGVVRELTSRVESLERKVAEPDRTFPAPAASAAPTTPAAAEEAVPETTSWYRQLVAARKPNKEERSSEVSSTIVVERMKQRLQEKSRKLNRALQLFYKPTP